MIYIPFFIVILIDKRDDKRGDKRGDTKNEKRQAPAPAAAAPTTEHHHRVHTECTPMQKRDAPSGTQRGKRGKQPQPYRHNHTTATPPTPRHTTA